MIVQFRFSVKRTYMISHIIVLSRLYHRPHIVQSVLIVQYHILLRSHDHVVVLFGFRDGRHSVRLVMIVHF